MKVQKGKLYKCIQNVIMEDGEIAYIKGKVYPSQIDGHITDEEGFINHEWSDCCSQDLEECFEEYEYHEEDKWEERRYELAKAAMSGILANSRFDELSESGFFKGNVVGNALSYADEMIRQLRGDCHKIIIPPIEKGHNWVQPDPKHFIIDYENGIVWMNKLDFDLLAQYDSKLPSNLFPGKMWKGFDPITRDFYLYYCSGVPGSDTEVDVKYAKIKIHHADKARK